MSSRLHSFEPGDEAIRDAIKPRRSLDRLQSSAMVAALASGAVLTLILVGCGGSQGARTQRAPDTASESAAPTDPRVIEVASHFQCPCGSCERLDLVECTCKEPHGATEIKAVIVALLDSGMTPERTIAQIAAQYGGLKPEGTAPQQPNAAQPNTLPSH